MDYNLRIAVLRLAAAFGVLIIVLSFLVVGTL